MNIIRLDRLNFKWTADNYILIFSAKSQNHLFIYTKTLPWTLLGIKKQPEINKMISDCQKKE